MQSTTEKFIRTLQDVERSREVDRLVELFAPEAELDSPVREGHEHGRDGARRFWETYLSAFDEVHSEFTRVNEGDGFAVLEWRSDGRTAGGDPLSYRGVSILETEDGRVRRFSTYYDSAAFLPGGAKRAGSAEGR